MLRSLLPLLLGLMILWTPCPRGGEANPARPDLVIVHTNDLHARYRPFFTRQGEIRGGFARIARRIEALRQEHGDRLLYLDAGDLFVGTPFYHFYRGSLGMELLGRMGCDAMALGNHELDDGSLNFFRASLGAEFPILCANLAGADGLPLLPGRTLLAAGDLRVEVIGLITENLPELINECVRGELVVTPPLLALDSLLAQPDMESDLRLVLSHCGIGEDRALAEALPGIPLIVGGHSHTRLEEGECVGDTFICQTGSNGYHLGVLECFREADGGWTFRERLEPVTEDWPEDPEIAAYLDRVARVVDREMAVVLADLPEAFSTRDKSETPNPLGILIAEAMRQAAGTDIGLQNVGGFRTDLPAGPLARGKLFELLPFDNRIMRLELGGEDLQALFDYLAANHGGGRFGQISGARYAIAGELAKDVHIGGAPLDPSARYTLATLDFLYQGGDGYQCLQEAEVSETLDLFAREVLEERLVRGPPPRPEDFPPNFEVR